MGQRRYEAHSHQQARETVTCEPDSAMCSSLSKNNEQPNCELGQYVCFIVGSFLSRYIKLLVCITFLFFPFHVFQAEHFIVYNPDFTKTLVRGAMLVSLGHVCWIKQTQQAKDTRKAEVVILGCIRFERKKIS